MESAASAPPLARFRSAFGLERNVVAMLGMFLALGMGEELWTRFIPKYLEILGAGALAVAVYGTLHDLLDALYPYPGGWLTDRIGRRASLVTFALLAIGGYALYLVAPSWPWILAGTVLVMAWSSLTLPAIFAVLGDHLPPGRRATGFGVMALLKRVPMIVAPPMGGWLIARLGFQGGIRAGLVATILLALLGIAVVRRAYVEPAAPPKDGDGLPALWRRMDPGLKRLLLADVMARWAEGIPRVFIVFFVLDALGRSAVEFGALTSVQMVAATVVYIPVAKVADRMNRKPFVLLTFAFFALFPLVLVTTHGTAWLVAAFIVAGLRETGEPARKALIVDLASAGARGRAVGLYYLIRGLAVFAAPLVGGWLWILDRRLPFYVAFGVGAAGFLVHARWGPGRCAEPSRKETVMKWITRERVKVDRVACPWLIKKFVDPEAEFLFVPAGQVMETAGREGAIPYDVEGVELGHHGGECSFEAILHKYNLAGDPVLRLLGRIVNGADTDNSLWHQPEGPGLQAIAEGFRHLGFHDDHEINRAEWIVYDALYAYCGQRVGARPAEN